MGRINICILFIGIWFISGCNMKNDADLPAIAVDSKDFNRIIDGKPVELFNLINENGMVVQISNYGASIVSIILPIEDDNFIDVALGYNSIEDYLNDEFYLGCIIGRYANRIANGTFSLDSKEYQLPLNDNNHSIHSGPDHFGTKVWDAEQSGDTLLLEYLSPHMEQGFPGDLKVELMYILTNDNALEIIYRAKTNLKTVVNLTNHTYLNLNGEGNGTILDHQLQIDGDRIVEINPEKISTGKFLPVQNTPFDFHNETAIGARMNDDHIQLAYNNGYGHCWVLSDEKQKRLKFAASVTSFLSDISLKFYTTEPGIQFYTATHFPDNLIGKSGRFYAKYGGITLEPQLFPDSPNHKHFPSAILEPGEEYYHKTVMAFEMD
jgi:aldose 1-epimerase